ncbi:MAG: Nuclear protein SET [Candidatus Peregrinibacteria bacterium Greene0416_62]|nr:MAG: Nuclear protein SET [Candidatus Peregrinibacteria bacterium Greene0416_62]TSC98379.1 MAG: Nuclear protein SET [Candidatus Peregrinibacteria bacterium Greene1014_49]
MLLCKTTLGKSPIHGIGVFAAHDIPKGMVIWEFTRGIDQEIPAASIEKLPALAQACIRKYAYRKPDSDIYVLCGDDTRFFNHSEEPTVISSSEDGPDIAVRDIRTGEELTIDYRTFDADAERKLRSFS